MTKEQFEERLRAALFHDNGEPKILGEGNMRDPDFLGKAVDTVVRQANALNGISTRTTPEARAQGKLFVTVAPFEEVTVALVENDDPSHPSHPNHLGYLANLITQKYRDQP